MHVFLYFTSDMGIHREEILARKRQEYADQVREDFNVSPADRSEDDEGALRQVSVDVPRTAPGVAFFHQEPVQRSLERILYIWGIRSVLSTVLQSRAPGPEESRSDN